MTDPITAYRAGLEAAAQFMLRFDHSLPAALIRALPVPAPDPMVVTVRLEWDEADATSVHLKVGTKVQGTVMLWDADDWRCAHDGWIERHRYPTEAEARDALLAAVRKALGVGE